MVFSLQIALTSLNVDVRRSRLRLRTADSKSVALFRLTDHQNASQTGVEFSLKELSRYGISYNVAEER
jgi:hypothetical protein